MKAKRKPGKSIKKLIIIAAAVLFAAAAIAVGIYLWTCYYTFTGYSVEAEIDLSSVSDSISYYNYENGYLQCAGDGLTYFNNDGIVWSSSFEMARPVIDVCGSYAAVADMKQSDIYVFDAGGLIGRITSSHSITDIEISSGGIIAAATQDGLSSYIEVKNYDGSELINVKTVFSSSGYLSDICLSEDGTRLAAAFIGTENGEIKGCVRFYDFSRSSTEEMLVGTFADYEGTILTDVEFLESGKVCVVGSDVLDFYSFADEVTRICENHSLTWEIQTLVIDESRVLVIVRDDEGENNYLAQCFNSSGSLAGSFGFDFAYTHATLSGANVFLYSYTDCMITGINAAVRGTFSFDEKIVNMTGTGRYNRLLMAGTGSVSILRFK